MSHRPITPLPLVHHTRPVNMSIDGFLDLTAIVLYCINILCSLWGKHSSASLVEKHYNQIVDSKIELTKPPSQILLTGVCKRQETTASEFSIFMDTRNRFPCTLCDKQIIKVYDAIHQGHRHALYIEVRIGLTRNMGISLHILQFPKLFPIPANQIPQNPETTANWKKSPLVHCKVTIKTNYFCVQQKQEPSRSVGSHPSRGYIYAGWELSSQPIRLSTHYCSKKPARFSFQNLKQRESSSHK